MALSQVELSIINELAHERPPLDHHADENVAFGGEGDWLYHIPSKRFDLSRGSHRKIVLDADDGVANHRGVVIDPEQTVLVVVDMQNYFIHPIYHEHTAGLAAVQPTLNVIEKCREEGIQVCWLNWGISDEDLKAMPAAVQRGFNQSLIKDYGHGWHVGLGKTIPDIHGQPERCLFTGTWNADIYDPLKEVVLPEDVRFDKARMSGMWSPKLEMHKWIMKTGKKTILFAGVNSDQCTLGTLIDCFNLGLDCIMIADCTGTMTGRNAQEVVEYNVAQNMGFVTNSREFINAKTVVGPLGTD